MSGKYAGGCSLTQSANDRGMMHNQMHSCFESTNFSLKDHPTPDSVVWRELEDYMKAWLATPDFE